jgi:ClpP class serine protease
MIFAREVSDSLTSLVKKIDAATVKNKDCKMGSFVVFLNDEENLDKKLKELAENEKLKKIALAIDNPGGPQAYKIAKDADITVVLYVGSYSKGAVKANYAFTKGEMKDKDIDKIVEALAKILPDKQKDK